MTTTRTTRSVSTLIAAGLAILAAGNISAATIEDFESGFGVNESTLGDASIRTGGYNGINAPSGGNGQLVLTTINNTAGNADFGSYVNQSGTTNAVDTGFPGFFGVAPLDGGTTGKEGSGFKITSLALTAGTTLSFDWDFLTQEGSNKDFAFYTLTTTTPSGVVVLTDALTATLMSTTGANNPFGSETGYGTLNIPISTSGTYTLTLGVMDAGSPSTDDSPSALLVDNIRTAATVPEPSTLGLILAGATSLAAVRRRIRK